MRKIVVIAVAVVGLIACGGENVTGPSEVSTAPSASAPKPAAEQPAVQPATDSDLSTLTVTATVDKSGVATIVNGTNHSVNKSVCYFKSGAHPQTLLDSQDVTIPAKSTATVAMPKFDLKCEEKLELQVDVVKAGACSGASNQLEGLLGWNYPVVEGECEPVCDPEPVGEPVVTYSDWEKIDCELVPSTTEGCFECQTRTKTTTQNFTCDKPAEIINESEYSRKEVDCPVKCEIPAKGLTLTWTGAGDPQTECRAFGAYDAVSDPPADFYICKAGNDREVMYSYPAGETCSNGKEISHVTLCVCGEK